MTYTEYRSYLLRLWRTRDGQGHVWRASLEVPGSGERRGFATLQDMFDFLQTQTVLQDDCGSNAQAARYQRSRKTKE